MLIVFKNNRVVLHVKKVKVELKGKLNDLKVLSNEI